MPATSMAAAAAAQHSRKIRKKRRSWCSFLTACFGHPQERWDTDTANEYVGKLVKVKRRRSGLIRTVPISRTTFVASPSYVTDSSGDGVAEKSRQLRPTPPHQVIMANKIDDQILEKSNNIHESGSTIHSENNNTIQISQSNNTTKSSDSVPPPQPQRTRERPTAVADNGRKGKTAKFDSKIGAVITTVTLIVMLIWGKACAVVCMAAWFYLIPRYYNEELMKLTNSSNDGDFDSWDYKKRVVLQGLLDRNRHVRGKILTQTEIGQT
ncbi:UNVERIFIED_CONTAM: hypothetical protein Slati_1787800 [Sesamum latifolium]|uniref:Uncharacterized protein n=1 Tax=Sesamum latifolium TaxID=2727402 RepID=A0AAW2WXG0_9LAMI